jgi:hypothetical protein
MIGVQPRSGHRICLYEPRAQYPALRTTDTNHLRPVLVFVNERTGMQPTAA